MSKIVTGLLVVMLCVAGLAGCGKTSEEPPTAPEQAQTQAQTAADYAAEAEKEITEENMADELDKIEQAVEEEAAQE